MKIESQVQQREQNCNPAARSAHNEIVELNSHIEHRQINRADRKQSHEINLKIRVGERKRKEKRQIQRSRCHQHKAVHHEIDKKGCRNVKQYAEENIEVKAEAPPTLLQHAADPVVKVKPHGAVNHRLYDIFAVARRE